MSGDQVENLLPLIVKLGFAFQLARYSTIAVHVIQVYDWLLCLSDEYLASHKARWTSVKVAYLFCRYYPLFIVPINIWGWVGNHPLSVCIKVWRQPIILLSVCPMLAQGVFLIRTYAFAGRNKFILAFLFACWTALLVTVLRIPFANYIFFDEWHILFGDGGCFWTHEAFNAHALFYLFTFLFDSLMTAIVLVQCIRFRGMRGQVGKVFVQQGLIAYLVLSAMNLTTAIGFFGPDRRFDSLAVVQTVTSNVIACRLILMLKRQADPTQQRAYSESIRYPVIQEEVTQSTLIDDASSHHNQPIEHWD